MLVPANITNDLHLLSLHRQIGTKPMQVALTGCPREPKHEGLGDPGRSQFGRKPRMSVWDVVNWRCQLDTQWRWDRGSWMCATNCGRDQATHDI